MSWISVGAFVLGGIIFTVILMRIFSVDQQKLTDPSLMAKADNEPAARLAKISDSQK